MDFARSRCSTRYSLFSLSDNYYSGSLKLLYLFESRLFSFSQLQDLWHSSFSDGVYILMLILVPHRYFIINTSFIWYNDQVLMYKFFCYFSLLHGVPRNVYHTLLWTSLLVWLIVYIFYCSFRSVPNWSWLSRCLLVFYTSCADPNGLIQP